MACSCREGFPPHHRIIYDCYPGPSIILPLMDEMSFQGSGPRIKAHVDILISSRPVCLTAPGKAINSSRLLIILNFYNHIFFCCLFAVCASKQRWHRVRAASCPTVAGCLFCLFCLLWSTLARVLTFTCGCSHLFSSSTFAGELLPLLAAIVTFSSSSTFAGASLPFLRGRSHFFPPTTY